jgi:hypothetical protein
VFLEIALGVSVYTGLAYFMKIDEMRQIASGIKGKLKSIVKN